MKFLRKKYRLLGLHNNYLKMSGMISLEKDLSAFKYLNAMKILKALREFKVKKQNYLNRLMKKKTSSMNMT